MHDEPTEAEWVNRPDGSISYAVNGYPDGTFDVSIYGEPGQGVGEYSPRFESIDEAREWAEANQYKGGEG